MLLFIILCKLIIDIVKLHHPGIKVIPNHAQSVWIDLIKRNRINRCLLHPAFIKLFHNDTCQIAKRIRFISAMICGLIGWSSSRTISRLTSFVCHVVVSLLSCRHAAVPSSVFPVFAFHRNTHKYFQTAPPVSAGRQAYV